MKRQRRTCSPYWKVLLSSGGCRLLLRRPELDSRDVTVDSGDTQSSSGDSILQQKDGSSMIQNILKPERQQTGQRSAAGQASLLQVDRSAPVYF